MIGITRGGGPAVVRVWGRLGRCRCPCRCPCPCPCPWGCRSGVLLTLVVRGTIPVTRTVLQTMAGGGWVCLLEDQPFEADIQKVLLKRWGLLSCQSHSVRTDDTIGGIWTGRSRRGIRESRNAPLISVTMHQRGDNAAEILSGRL